MWVNDNYYVYEEDGKLVASPLVCGKPRIQRYYAYIGNVRSLGNYFLEFKRKGVFYWNGEAWDACDMKEINRIIIAVVDEQINFWKRRRNDYVEEEEWRKNLPKLEKTAFPFDNKKRDSCDCCKKKFWTKWDGKCGYELNIELARVAYTTMGVKVLCHKCMSWYWKHDALPNYER